MLTVQPIECRIEWALLSSVANRRLILRLSKFSAAGYLYHLNKTSRIKMYRNKKKLHGPLLRFSEEVVSFKVDLPPACQIYTLFLFAFFHRFVFASLRSVCSGCVFLFDFCIVKNSQAFAKLKHNNNGRMKFTHSSLVNSIAGSCSAQKNSARA